MDDFFFVILIYLNFYVVSLKMLSRAQNIPIIYLSINENNMV